MSRGYGTTRCTPLRKHYEATTEVWESNCFLVLKSAANVGVSFMVCEELVHLEWDFIQARAGSPDTDSLGWTKREFSCLDAILDHKREGHQGQRCPGD